MFIAELKGRVIVLLQEYGITATVRLCRGRVHYQKIALVAGALRVQLITVFIRRPEGHSWFTAFCGDALRRPGL